MKNWARTTSDGTEYTVQEVAFEYDLHAFEILLNEEVVTTIYPCDIDAMKNMIDDLENGANPIEDSWEDGLGNSCASLFYDKTNDIEL